MDKLQVIDLIKDKKYTHEQLVGWQTLVGA